MANLTKIQLSGVTYNLVDETAIHSLEGYATTGDVQSAVTAGTAALADEIAKKGYQNAEQVNAAVEAGVAGKADATAVTASLAEKADKSDTYTKEEVDQKVAESGHFDSSLYYTTAQTNSLLDGKADKTAVTASLDEKVGYVSYESEAKTITFRSSATGAVIGTVDTTDFIKDGMVENVEVKDGKLVITFNTDSGKEAIEIEISKIFNASNYYTKNEADGKFGTLTEQQSLRSDLEDALGEIASLEADKADKTAVTADIASAKGELEGEIAKKADSSAVTADIAAAKSELNTEIAKKADKSYVDGELAEKADKGESYTKAEADAKFANKPTVEGTTLVFS